MAALTNNIYSFGEFEVDAERRLLLKRGELVPLRSKTFDLLLVLIENNGQLVSKNDLLDRVWKDQFVEENNLTVHIATLRKALGEKKNESRYIVTLPGKGYRFIAEDFRPMNGEVVVESRKFQKIVVSEELEEQTSDENGDGRRPHSDPVLDRRRPNAVRPIRLALFAVVVVGLAGLAGAYAFRGGIARDLFSVGVPFRTHQLTQLTTNGKVGNAALSPDGKLFAYVIDDVGLKSLWIGRVAGGGNHLELRPPAEAIYHTLVFSPDSSQIYFSIRDDKNPKSALYSVPVQGGVSTKLSDGIEGFALSPDGKQLAVGRSEGGNDVLAVSSLDGKNGRVVASFPKTASFLFDSISWSPNGERLAISAKPPGDIYRQELAIVEASTGATTRIPVTNYRHITKTSWLQDGRGLILTAIEEGSYSSVPHYRLVYVSYPDGVATEITSDRSNYGESWHNDAGATLSLDASSKSIMAVEHRQLSNVWVAPADDLSAARQITFSSFGRYDGLWGLDWSPDGSIIYTTSDTRNQYLSRMNADGSGQEAITNPIDDRGLVDSVLTVSSDGQTIFFHSNRTNFEMDIWRANIDGSDPKQLTFGGKAFHPAPSPDGKWVYYKSFLNEIGSLCRVPAAGGDPECLTDKETSWMSFSPDGKFIAASYITDKRRLAIISADTHEIVRQFDLPGTATFFMGSRWTPDGRSITYRDTAHGYWLQDVEGGEPRRLEGLPKEKFYNFSWSRDGKWFAFVRGQEIRDVVLLTRDE
jgi:DNA-binding winged helix-turn-helix (wHTH) protein/Tol biopolymer transport system component